MHTGSTVRGCKYDIYKVQSTNEHIYTNIHPDARKVISFQIKTVTEV
jgi:hypothetical protein